MPHNQPSPPDGSVTPTQPLPLWKVWLPPLLILCAAASLALASFLDYERTQRAICAQESARVKAGIAERLRDYEFVLRGGQGLLNNSQSISNKQWRDYVQGLDYASYFPDALGLGYAPYVPGDGLARHRRERRAESPGYDVYPSGARPDYFPLNYLEPANARNRRGLGFDVGSEPVRRAAIERARDTGEASLTGKVILMKATGEFAQPSCLLIVPVYRPGASTGTVAERRAALRGVLISPFRVGSLLSGILGTGGQHLSVAVYDGAARTSETLLFNSGASAPGGFSHVAMLDFYGQKWTLVFSRPQISPFAPERREPLVLLFLGSVLAAAVLLIGRNIDVTRARAEALAAAMTAELRQSEAYNRTVFQFSILPVAVCGLDDRFLDTNPAMLDLLGYTREEFLQMFWQDVIHPDDWAEHARLAKEAMAGERENYRIELRALRKDRQLVSGLLSVGVARDENGQALFFIGAFKDASESKAAEEAQAARRALYQVMFEGNRSVCLLVDPRDGRIVDANRAAAAFYGYPLEELLRLNAGDLNTLPPEKMAQALAEAGTQGGVFDFVHRLKDGTLRNVRVHSGPFDTGGGALILSTVQDVTDQVRTEAALSESRERFRNLVESTDQGVVLNDEEDRITYVNPAFARLLGYAGEELVGRTAASVMMPEAAQNRAQQIAARRQGSREIYETGLTRADGSELMVRVMPFPLYDAHGEFQGSCGLVVDITAQHAAHEIEQRRQRRRAALLHLHEMQHTPRQELLDYALEQVLQITASQYGYICSYDDGARQFTLHAWSKEVMAQCRVEPFQNRYLLDETGVWGDAVRRREPVLLNDFSAPHPGKGGQPEGHVALDRFLSVPVIRAGRVRAVVGVANKKSPYTDEDITQLKLFTDGLWGILERQDAEQELREVTERFQRAVRAGRVGLWEWDLKSGAAHCDKVMEELFGLDDKNRTGTPEDWLARVAPEERETVRQAVVDAAAKGERFAASFRVQRPDGGVAHIEASAVAQVGPKGEPLRLVGVNIDVSRLREAELRLAQSEERFRHLFENAPIPYQSLDADGNLLLVNAAWLDSMGYAAEEVLGRNFAEFLHPDSQVHFREQFAKFKKLGHVGGIEYLLRSKDGGTHLVSVNGRVACDAQGRFQSTHCTFIDITERRAAEEQLARNHRFLQNLIDTLPVPFVCKDSQGRYLLVNESFTRLYGLAKDQVLGRTLREFGPLDNAERHCSIDEKVLTRVDGDCAQYEETFAPPGEEPRHWLVFKSHLRLADGGSGIAAIAIDITERKQAEEALREERRRLTDVIEGTNTGTWEWDLESGALLCNERLAQILGRTLEAFSSATMDSLLDVTHPEDVPLCHEALGRHFSGETPFFDVELRMRHVEERWVWVHVRGRVFKRGQQGQPLLMSGALSDIDARKSTEERLALVARFPVENPHPVLRADAKGVLLYANPSAEPLLTSWGQKVGGKLPRELRHELRLALDSGQSRTSERSYASGVYSFTVAPFVDKGYANVYAVNETQRKAAEMALRLGELRYRELAVMLQLMCDNVPDMIWAKDMENRYLFANKAMCEQLLCLREGEQPLGKTEEYFAKREQAAHPEEPDWHTLWEACLRSDLETLDGRGLGQYEEVGYCLGQIKHFDVRKAPFVNGQGVVIGTVGSARDITEKKSAEEALARSEERFRTLAQVSPVGIFQADTTGRCTYVNDQWARISGYPKVAALGMGWLRTLNTADRRGILRGFRETARTGDDFVTELRFRPAQGQQEGRWVLVRAAAERGPQGGFTGFVGAVTDITELKRAEVALRQAKAEAEAATEAKALFLANMSHEIRTPLSGVIGTTRLLSQSQLDEAQRQLVDMAVDSGRALLDVVNDILDFSKIEAGQFKLRSAPFSLRHTLECLVGPMAILGRERGLYLKVDVARGAPDALVGDEARLGQVLRNLLTNAIKFTDAGGVTLAVQPEPRSGDEVRLFFSVTDTGIGIEPSYLPRLFDSFSQSDSSYGKRHGGTGLGLAICKSLVEQMGGSIQVRSSLGKGSTFTVTLSFGQDVQPQMPAVPAASAGPAVGQSVDLGAGPDTDSAAAQPSGSNSVQAAAQNTGPAAAQNAGQDRQPASGPAAAPAPSTTASPAAASPTASPTTSSAALSAASATDGPGAQAADQAPRQAMGQAVAQPIAVRVLLADDNAIGRVLMEHVLKNAGYDVACVADGREVLRALRRERFGLVLMDVQMPRMDGLTTTRQIRMGEAGAENRNIAVVALTAYTSREDRQNFIDAGMDDAVSKPAEERPLFEAMERALAAAAGRARSDDAERTQAVAEPKAAYGAPVPAHSAPAATKPERLDQEYLSRSFGDNHALLALLLRQFQDKSLPEITRSLEESLAGGDLRRAREVAHRTRGTLASIGAARGMNLAAAAENAAVKEDWARYAEMAAALQEELSALGEHLRQDLPWGYGEEEKS